MISSLCAYRSTLGSQYQDSLNVPGTADAQLRIGPTKSFGSGKSRYQAESVIGTFFFVPVAAVSVLASTDFNVALIPTLANCWVMTCDTRASSPVVSVQNVVLNPFG